MNKAVITMIALAATPITAMAADFDYSYFDASIAFTELDGNTDVTNFNFEYMSPLNAGGNSNLFWHAGLDMWDANDVDANYMAPFGGIGIYTSANAALDIGGYADLQYAFYEAGPFDDSEIGLRLGGFARYAATDSLDIEGGVTHSTAFDGYTDIYARALFALAPNMDIGGGLRLGDNGDGLEVRFRYGF